MPVHNQMLASDRMCIAPFFSVSFPPYGAGCYQKFRNFSGSVGMTGFGYVVFAFIFVLGEPCLHAPHDHCSSPACVRVAAIPVLLFLIRRDKSLHRMEAVAAPAARAAPTSV